MFDSMSGEKRRFDLLALDYQMARDDERTFATIQAAVASLAVVVLAAIATVVGDACALNGTTHDCKNVPRGFLAGAPAIPLAALSFVQLLGMVSALRSYYIRAVESELRKYTQLPLGELAEASIKPASYYGLITEVVTLRRGRSGYRILSTMIMLIGLVVFGGLTVFIAIQLGGNYRNAMLLGYGVAFAVLTTDVTAATFGARSTFTQVALKFRDRQSRPLLSGISNSSPHGRSLASYLAWPRPEDWIKWLFVPGSYLVTSWVERKAVHWNTLVLAVLITEYLVYSARYQWNDIRGMTEDASHPQSAARLRLPSSHDRGQRRFIVGASLVVALLRLVTATVLGAVTGQTLEVLTLIGLVFLVATVYELLRTAESSSIPNLVRKLSAITLWVVVGSGYALRFLVGVYAAHVSLYSELAKSGALFMFAYGIMFVLLTWTLEASSYCYRETGLAANSVSSSPKAHWYTDGRLHRKPHLMLLLRPLAYVTGGLSKQKLWRECGDESVLDASVFVFSPWNLAYWSACVTGGWLATTLTHDAASGWLLFTSLVGAVSASWPDRFGVRAIIAICSSGVLWCVAAWDSNPFDPVGAAISLIPWVLATITYLFFRQQSYRQLKNFAVDLRTLFTSIGRKAVRVVTGLETWKAIR